MEYILTKKEMREADERTSSSMHIPSPVLMERAALAVADCVLNIIDSMEEASILVVAGCGNNGGDGFAAGRILLERGIKADFCLIGPEEKCSEGEKEEIASLRALDEELVIYDEIPENNYKIVIDAIFGIALNRDVEGKFRDAVEGINRLRENGARVVSIDIPSGINADSGKVMGAAVFADYTIACAFRKPGLLLNPGAIHAGKIITAKVGITEKSFCSLPLISAPTAEDLRLPERISDSNKGTYGKVLVVAGSDEICGAALLAAKAALKTGCGMVKVFTHENNRTAIQSSFPEALITVYDESENITDKLKKSMEWSDSIVVGPGMGKGDRAKEILSCLLESAKVPIVADADALNIISENPEILEGKDPDMVITPHIGEMSRLTGLSIIDIKDDPVETARRFATEHRLICVLKDARTVTAMPDGRAVINTSGNNGMSTAGSGDVLAGMLGSLIAQGLNTEEAAWRGVFLHGAAGDKAKEKTGAHAMLAGDIISAISEIE